MAVLGIKKVHIAGMEPIRAKILKDLQDPLISVPRLCSQGYIITFTKDEVQIRNSRNQLIVSGARDSGEGGLYKIPIISQPRYQFPMTGTDILDTVDTVEEELVFFMPNLSTYYGGMSFRSKAE